MGVWTVHTAPGVAEAGPGADALPPAVAAVGVPPAPVGSVPAAGAAPVPSVRPRRRRPPPAPVVLVRDGFSWAAFVFGPLWLLWHRLWLPALAYVVLAVAAAALLPDGPALALGLALEVLLGLHAHDLRRRALARRGYAEAGVVAERSLDLATARLLDRRPDLAAPIARAELA